MLLRELFQLDEVTIDNVNGAGEEHISRRVYDFEGKARVNQIKFFHDLTSSFLKSSYT